MIGLLITWGRERAVSRYRSVQLRVVASWAVLVGLLLGIGIMAALLDLAPSPAVVVTCSPGMVVATIVLLAFPYRLHRRKV